MSAGMALFPAYMGAVTIGVLAYLDFHSPYRITDVRYAVMRERYWLAAGLYIAIALAFYFILVNFVTGFVFALARGTPASQSEPQALSLASIATVFLFILFVKLPGSRTLSNAVRSMLQALARYPQAAQTVVALIARAPFAPVSQARAEAVRQLESYAVPSEVVEEALTANNKVLAAAAGRLLVEICSLHACFRDLQEMKRYRHFFFAKRQLIDGLDRQYHRWLRQTARTLLIAEDLSMSSDDTERLVLEMSDFIAEDGEILQSHYRRLLAELTLSCASNPTERRRLLANFGYGVAVSRTLPFWPLTIVFIIDFAIALLPAILTGIPAQSKMSLLSATATGLAHAFALTMAVLFAIYPKLTSNFARPSLFSLPLNSYVLYGVVSYLVGVAAYSLVFVLVDLPTAFVAARHPFLASVWFSIMFPCITIILGILLDFRLRNPQSDFQHGRTRDGVLMAVAMGVTVIILQLGIVSIAWAFGATAPPFPMGLRVTFTGLFAALGFAMGYIIPSTTEAYFNEVKIILASDIKGKPPAWSEDTTIPAPYSQST